MNSDKEKVITENIRKLVDPNKEVLIIVPHSSNIRLGSIFYVDGTAELYSAELNADALKRFNRGYKWIVKDENRVWIGNIDEDDVMLYPADDEFSVEVCRALAERILLGNE